MCERPCRGGPRLCLGFASFLEKLGLYVESHPVVDTHHNMRGVHERMVAAWKESEDVYKLSKADVDRILEARTHPSMR